MTDIPIFKPYVNERAIELVAETLRSGWVGEGPRVKEFESKVGSLVGAAYPVSVNSGTSALHLALMVAGIQPGDEVITTAQTMLATTEVILMCGATPVYADVQYGTGNIDPADISHRITPRTRAILCVDWGGYPCDYDDILDIGRKHGLMVIEDGAHALGATYRGKPVGSICPYTCFSFQAIKHLTTGDGGLVCLPTEEMYSQAIRLRWFGIDRFKRQPSILGEPIWNVTELGYKYQMNDVAASIGLGNLEDLDKILSKRHQVAAMYRQALKTVSGIQLFDKRDDRQSSNWLFSMHVERREDFCRAMLSRGVQTSVVHLRIDRNDICGGERNDLPQLARFTETHISLPQHPLLTDQDVNRIIESVCAGW
jgi:perosamine synthetase